MLVWLRGQNSIMGNFGVEMQFWKVLRSKCNFGKVWDQNVICGILGLKCNFGKVWG
jgi:hypothetical protein